MKKRDKRKVKKVYKEYINNGFNMSEALRTTEKDSYIGREKYLTVKATRWRNCKELMDLINEEMKEVDITGINKTFVISELVKIVKDSKSKKSDVNNALSILSKCLSLSNDTKINISNIVGDNKLKTLLNR